MPLAIVGIGTANPPHVLGAADAQEMLGRLCATDKKQARLASAMVRLADVDQRQTCVPFGTAYEWEGQPNGPTLGERMELYEQHAAPLAIESAQQALQDADVQPRQVTHLVTVSCTGFEAPGVDIRLIQELGLRTSVERVHVGFMGCHAAINAIRVAEGLLASNPQATVLLVATELCSLHYCYGWKPEQMVGNAIFGDGSAAIVAVNRRPAETSDRCQWVLDSTGSQLIPDSASQMSWRVRDFGFEMRLSADLPPTIERSLRGWLEEWTARRRLSIEQMGSWAIHPGGPKIVTSVQQALEIATSCTTESQTVLREHGNMSSPTLLFVIERLRQNAARGPCLAIAFGPGITAEVALFR